MRLKFSKMHGLGNDFVVLNGVTQAIQLSREQLRYLADRHRGVGCDQILLVESATQPNVDFRYRIFNADGGEVEQCGNGARCFVHFVRDQGLTTKDEIRVETKSGIIAPRLNLNGEVSVDMGAPRFAPGDVPLRRATRAARYELDVAGVKINVSALSMGNPHAVQVVDDVDAAPVLDQGPLIEHRRGVDIVDHLHRVGVAHGKRADVDFYARNVEFVARGASGATQRNIARREARRTHIDANLAVKIEARCDDAALGFDPNFVLGCEPLIANEVHETACAVATLLDLAAVSVENAITKIHIRLGGGFNQ